MKAKATNQLILVGVLGLVLVGVLYVTTGRDTTTAEPGLETPLNIALLESELAPGASNEWPASTNQRNPFVGPFTKSGDSEPELVDPEAIEAQVSESE